MKTASAIVRGLFITQKNKKAEYISVLGMR